MPADIETSIIINSSIEHVKKTFLDFNSYSNWSIFLKSIKSKESNQSFEPGSQLEVELESKPGSITKMNPIVLVNTTNEFKWVGKLPLNLFEGSHKFEFNEIDSNKTEVIQTEEFSGLLKSPILWLVGESTIAGFKNFNEALKKQCESS